MIIQKIFSDLEEEEKIYSVLLDEEELSLFSEIQKEFTGAVKRANKAVKRAWLEKQGAGGFLGIGKKTGDEAVRAARKKIESDLIKTGRSGVIKLEGGIPTKRIPNPDPNSKIRSLNEKINRKGVYEENYLGNGLATSPSRGRNNIVSFEKSNGRVIFDTPETSIRTMNATKLKR